MPRSGKSLKAWLRRTRRLPFFLSRNRQGQDGAGPKGDIAQAPPTVPMERRVVPTQGEARRVNEAIVEAYLESNPGAFEAVAFAAERMQEVIDLAEGAPGMCAKAATVMCGTSWAQPFAGANKRTGVALARLLLSRGGFDVECPEGGSGSDRLRRLLYDAQGRRASLDRGTVLRMQAYMWPRLRGREAGAEALEAAVRRIIRENAGLFDYMARETPLPAALSAEEREAERLVGECADAGALAARMLRALAPRLSPRTARLLAGPRGAP